MNNTKPLLTRRRLAELITERVGIRMTAHMIAIRCSKGSGPKPVARQGRIHLYEEDEGLAWGWSLVKPIEAAA